jgi:bisanhydrobacterioruberin hydratase|tara:strand:+ start:8545 stop:9195 length:651 start_codon:yes stop_codon:yes gene_type:complete
VLFDSVKNRPSFIAMGVILILHFVGIFGLHSIYSDSFASLTPLNLLVTFLLILPFKGNTSLRLIVFFMFTFALGMLVEIIGVQTGIPFGSYYYTSRMSLAVFGVPLMIGINWFLLTYGLISGVNYLAKDVSFIWKVLLCSALMTFMDLLIEPFAIKYQLWVWESAHVPIQNYIAWFVVSSIIFSLGFKIIPKERNRVAAFTIIVFFLFFGVNYLTK